jgi:hypothetical protein
MSLRQKLLERSKVAGCDYQQSQLRNFPEISATDELRRGSRPPLESCASCAQLRPCCDSCAPHYDLWPRLEAAVNRCGDYWGDSPERRAEMLESLRSMPERCQQAWVKHLDASYGQIERGERCGGYLFPPPFESGAQSAC